MRDGFPCSNSFFEWEWLMRTKDKSGQWVKFAGMTLARRKAQ